MATRAAEDPSSLVGYPVVLARLSAKPELNGQRGLALAYNEESSSSSESSACVSDVVSRDQHTCQYASSSSGSGKAKIALTPGARAKTALANAS